MNELLERAIKLAQKYHEDQFDKGGQPYIDHPLRVMNGVESIDEKVVAVLHDVLEDCDVSKEKLIEEGIPYYLVEKLEILCKGKNENYFDYIERIKADSLAIKVKLSDLKDNMNLERLKEITEKNINRLEKYKKAKEILEAYM
ncbi:HD domain-containing protein [Clostridium saccharobutylicum]|uniref:Bifunctional (P)ppGpp synthase/hydrolase RelA n=1 Tax=Clostridium saccharobutylicum TaxID=169679 RepID=A0A1S8NE11_CLOSA|nr:HD domain-containing protein [Clostridium saccharobutylicum]OOM14648.1 bifunctional (p)ppGpp synthase/hydrolase RelA [Clostridium saccharobutylicum]